VNNKVVFTGSIHHSQVFGCIGLMDVTIMAKSNWYGSPIKIFEYGMMGKPIIAPDNIPVNDIMINGMTGLLIQPDVDHLHISMK
jgi:glycosyltransferase involved in cell wall biosynthesis